MEMCLCLHLGGDDSAGNSLGVWVLFILSDGVGVFERVQMAVGGGWQRRCSGSGWAGGSVRVTESQWMESNTCCLGAAAIPGGACDIFALFFPEQWILIWWRLCVLCWCVCGWYLFLWKLFSFVDKSCVSTTPRIAQNRCIARENWRWKQFNLEKPPRDDEKVLMLT